LNPTNISRINLLLIHSSTGINN